MRQVTSVVAASLLSLGSPAFADSTEDARYIVEETVTKELFETAIRAQKDLIAGALIQQLGADGITLNDPEGFIDILVEEFIDEFTVSMKDSTAELYLELFDEQELSDIAQFYSTPSGQALIAATPTLVEAGVTMGQEAGQRAGVNATPRVAARLEDEGIIITEDKDLMPRLLDLLR